MVKAFVKVFVGDFSSNRTYETVLTAQGTFSITAPAGEFQGADQFIQWGFQVTGPIADEGNEPSGRAVTGIKTINPALLSTESFVENTLSVVPNPSSDSWRISASSPIENVQVYDILGKQVLTLAPSSLEVEVPAQELKSGLYLARITGADGSDKTIRLLRQ